MSARLPPALEAAAIMREAEGRGGFAALLHRGDPDAGTILVLIRERGEVAALLERVLTRDGDYAWEANPRVEQGNEDGAASLLGERRSFDPDLWAIELDVAEAERFAAEWLAAR